MLHRVIRQINVSRDRFRCVSVVFLYAAKIHSYLLYSSSHVKNSIPYSQFLRLRRLCSEDSDFSLKSEEMCEFSTNVAILPPLLKQAIIAPNKLIGSRHYKRLRRRITI